MILTHRLRLARCTLNPLLTSNDDPPSSSRDYPPETFLISPNVQRDEDASSPLALRLYSVR